MYCITNCIVGLTLRRNTLSYNYYEQLSGKDKARYDEKLMKMGIAQCPYKIRANAWIADPTKWPQLQYADLFNYLIESPSEIIYMPEYIITIYT